MAKANLFYNSKERRWELRDRYGVTRAEWNDGSYAKDYNGRVIVGVGTIRDLNVPTLATLRALNVAGVASLATINITTGTLTNINVGTLATLQAINVSGVGTIRDLNVPTLATIRRAALTTLQVDSTVNVEAVASIARVVTPAFNLGVVAGNVGATLGLIHKLTGTIALTAIGTGAMAVATVSGQGSAGIAVGDLIFGTPKGDLSGIGIVGWFVPTTNVITAYIMNPNSQGGGSLPAVGVDLTLLRF